MSRRLSIPEAAAYLNISVRGARKLVEDRAVPFYKVGHLIRFEQDDLDAYLQAGRVEAVQR